MLQIEYSIKGNTVIVAKLNEVLLRPHTHTRTYILTLTHIFITYCANIYSTLMDIFNMFTCFVLYIQYSVCFLLYRIFYLFFIFSYL